MKGVVMRAELRKCAGVGPVSHAGRPSTSQARRGRACRLAAKPASAQPSRRAGRVVVKAGQEGGGGGNPFGNMGNFMKQLKQAQEVMQVEAVKVQKEMQEAEFEGFSSDETVRVVMSGNQEAKGCDITQAAYSQGAEALGDLITEAYKDAHEKSLAAMKQRMAGLASSLGLPQNPNM
mmetsp:Transcript_1495/g.4269  ORF Transcript_1495/g.4269 Transcript_1495/m.4269 type:complete len:177 (-) Transcript_1495:72-602(-)